MFHIGVVYSKVGTDKKSQILPVISLGSKMLFPEDHSPVRQVILEDANSSRQMKDTFDHLLGNFEDILLTTTNDIRYTTLTEIDIVTDPNMPPIASKLQSLPQKHRK